ncbi:MAG TPA: hypothetical protein VLI41_06805 [Phenylobacterium sp.]|uniref:hypothetical protein n=1 Tax=Phenylobacterium sp. TaxID=1871053 RepID=UPI002BC5D2CD|nr:hypothetical protein [Phenylobacterium sp.]HSV02900.1 hypothetical protein [Phenylobacterium sp.]
MAMRSSKKVLLASAFALGAAGCATQTTQREAALTVKPVISSALPTQRDDGLYRDAVSAIHRRDYAAALDILQVARARTPNDPRILNAFGVVYDELGRFDLSARYYAQAQTADPNSKIVAENLGYSAVLQGAASSVALAAEAPRPAPSSGTAAAQLAAAAPVPTPMISSAAEPLNPTQLAVSPDIRRAALPAAHLKLAPASLPPQVAAAAPVAAPAIEIQSVASSRLAEVAAAPAAVIPAAVAQPAWPQFAAAAPVRAPAVEVHPLMSLRPAEVAAAPATAVRAALAQPVWPALADPELAAAASADPDRNAARAHAYAFDPTWNDAPLLIAAPPEARPANLVRTSFLMPGPLLLPDSAGGGAAPAPAAPMTEHAAPVRAPLAAAEGTRISHKTLLGRAWTGRRDRPRPLHFVMAALGELAHVLHLPFGHATDSGVLLASRQPARAPNAAPAAAQEAPSAASAAVAAHLQPAAWTASAANTAGRAPEPGRSAASTQPPLLGGPVTLIAADRKAAAALKRELARQGWTVAISPASSRASRESVIRFQPAHRRVALGLAHSLRIPVKLQACGFGCSGVSLVVGTDAFAQYAGARREPRRLS